MADTYDLVVVGAGAAGLAAAEFAAQIGARVALVEREQIGGDCTWTGCVPSKALIEVANLAHRMRNAERWGLEAADPGVDLQQVGAYVNAAVERVRVEETSEALEAKGILVLLGTASFRNPHTLDVGERDISGRRFVLATGAKPAIPDIAGLGGVPYRTYRDIFQPESLPRHLLVLGAGPVGLELGQAFRRLGSAVTIFDRSDRVLPVADPEASAVLGHRLVEEGIRLELSTEVEQIERCGDRTRLTANGRRYEGDALLVAAGRKPSISSLQLERADVAYGEGGVRVNGKLQTTQPHIYAAGDVTGGPQFAHFAGWQGVIAARNALLPGATSNAPHPPWAVFTDPEIAQVGLSEAETRARWGRIVVQRWPVERIDRAQTAGEPSGFLKLVAKSDGTLVGSTIVASGAAEMANELAVAITQKLKMGALARTIHVYPTYGFGIQQASADALVRELSSGWRGQILRFLVRRWPR